MTGIPSMLYSVFGIPLFSCSLARVAQFNSVFPHDFYFYLCLRLDYSCTVYSNKQVQPYVTNRKKAKVYVCSLFIKLGGMWDYELRSFYVCSERKGYVLFGVLTYLHPHMHSITCLMPLRWRVESLELMLRRNELMLCILVGIMV